MKNDGSFSHMKISIGLFTNSFVHPLSLVVVVIVDVVDVDDDDDDDDD